MSPHSPMKDTRPTANPEEWDLTTVSAVHGDNAWAPQDAAMWAAAGSIDGSPMHECGSESPNHGSSESDTGMAPAMFGRYETAHAESGERSGASLSVAAVAKIEQRQEPERTLFDHKASQVCALCFFVLPLYCKA